MDHSLPLLPCFLPIDRPSTCTSCTPCMPLTTPLIHDHLSPDHSTSVGPLFIHSPNPLPGYSTSVHQPIHRPSIRLPSICSRGSVIREPSREESTLVIQELHQ